MTKLRYRDQMLLEALRNTLGLQLDGSGSRAGVGKWRYWEASETVKN